MLQTFCRNLLAEVLYDHFNNIVLLWDHNIYILGKK